MIGLSGKSAVGVILMVVVGVVVASVLVIPNLPKSLKK